MDGERAGRRQRRAMAARSGAGLGVGWRDQDETTGRRRAAHVAAPAEGQCPPG